MHNKGLSNAPEWGPVVAERAQKILDCINQKYGERSVTVIYNIHYIRVLSQVLATRAVSLSHMLTQIYTLHYTITVQ